MIEHMPRACCVLLFAIAFVAMTSAAPAEARKREPQTIDLAVLAASELEALGTSALHAGDAQAAIQYFAELVARQPRNGRGQALLGMSYQLAGEADPQAIDLAMAGYDLAMRVEPGQFWPAALGGRAAFDTGKYDEALSHFARALLLRPSDDHVALGVAAAAYMNGDVGLASLAADHAARLTGGVEALKLAAVAAAAFGDAELTHAHLTELAAAHPDAAQAIRTRAVQLLQTAAIDRWHDDDASSIETPGSAPRIASAEAPNQISLDVAIILAQNTRRVRTGLNLLDGLGLQYGLDRQTSRVIRRDDGVRTANEYQRILTTSISVPQLNYNLNLFNRGGQYYSVVARPQLTAYRGEESEFFIGRTLKVAVGGVNLGSLEQIDIGIEMRVTPVEITPDGTRVRIETGRSFLTADPAGSFAEALTTFRQRVAATAEIRFGETLLLSGLNETVDDRTYSKTPLLGDIPGVGSVFNERNDLHRQDSVLVLVTPARPIALPGRPWARAEHVQRLATLWTDVVDLHTGADTAIARLNASRTFTRMMRSDVDLTRHGPRYAVNEALRELAAPGGAR